MPNPPLSSQSDTPQTIDATCSRCRADGKGTYRTEALCANCGWCGKSMGPVFRNRRYCDEVCKREANKARRS